MKNITIHNISINFKVSNPKFPKTLESSRSISIPVLFLRFEKRLSDDPRIVPLFPSRGTERRIELFGWPASVDFTPIIALSSISRAARDIVPSRARESQCTMLRVAKVSLQISLQNREKVCSRHRSSCQPWRRPSLDAAASVRPRPI